ncbi:MAG: helix-turn-helix transcriptional regulator [Steroidobacteraceae bacterium]
MPPELRLERLPEVLGRRGDSRSQLYLDVQRGTWPPPIRLGRASTWPAHENQQLLAARIAGASTEELRQLVQQLLERRKALMPALGTEAA